MRAFTGSAILGIGLACAFGCKPSVTESSVVGTYKQTQFTTGHAQMDADFKRDTVTLDVRPDHTYRELINGLVPDDGTWSLTDGEFVMMPRQGLKKTFDVRGNTLSFNNHRTIWTFVKN
jgi:hypothetical protein